MTAPPSPPAGRAELRRWLPSTAHELVDALFTVALTLLGLAGFRQVYGGRAYLVAGAAGLAAGLLVAHVTTRAKLAAPYVALAAVVSALLLGAVPLRDTAVAGVLPSLDTVRGLGDASVFGWKQLLTTLRPVGATGNLLALPYLLGLVAAAGAYATARRTRLVALPLLPPVAVVALGILFGTDQPAAAVVQGALFTSVALAWASVRRARQRLVLVQHSRRAFRTAAAGLLLATSFAGAAVAGPGLPLATARPRTVLHAEPPLDLGVYASPLAAFRRYTKAVPPQQSLADSTLFTVEGADPGELVRIAALDEYDGTVWGASNRDGSDRSLGGFVRTGTTLPTPGHGPGRTVSITVAEGYRDVWLPSVGAARRVSFDGPRATEAQASLRYNVATRTGLVPAGLREGDVVLLEVREPTRLSDTQLGSAEPEHAPVLDPASYQFVSATATKFAGSEQTPLTRVLRIATTLRDGSYSHGRDGVPSDPGHGTGRIATFLQARQLVGDDEQYGAAMALMANAVGVPARVVLIGAARADGTVRGRDVQVGVELAVAGHGWVPLDTGRFTPPRDRKPQRQPKEALPKVRPKVVPPPLRAPLSGSFSSSEAESSVERAPAKGKGFSLPAPLVAAVRLTGPPAGVLAAVAGSILAAKALRRRRRRTRGPATTRVAMGWTEILDAARDLGAGTVAPGTRREQARALDPLPVAPLAVAADAIVFGPGDPTPEDVDGYWRQVDAVRASMTGDLSRWRRIRAALSLRSLLPAAGVAPAPRVAGATS